MGISKRFRKRVEHKILNILKGKSLTSHEILEEMNRTHFSLYRYLSIFRLVRIIQPLEVEGLVCKDGIFLTRRHTSLTKWTRR